MAIEKAAWSPWLLKGERGQSCETALVMFRQLLLGCATEASHEVLGAGGFGTVVLQAQGFSVREGDWCRALVDRLGDAFLLVSWRCLLKAAISSQGNQSGWGWENTPNKGSHQEAGSDLGRKGTQGRDNTVISHGLYHVGLVCRRWKPSPEEMDSWEWCWAGTGVSMSHFGAVAWHGQ